MSEAEARGTLLRHFREDYDLLEQECVGSGIKASFVRQSLCPILRRWLIDQTLARVARACDHKLEIFAEDLRFYHRTCRSDTKWLFVSTRAKVGDTAIGNFMWEKDGTGNDLSFDFREQDAVFVRLKLDDFVRQRLWFLDGEWVTRGDIIKYISNKWGGVHSDVKLDKASDIAIEKYRYLYAFRLKSDDTMDMIVNHNGDMSIVDRQFDNDVVDMALLVLLNTAQLLVPSLTALRKAAGAAS